jgi:hypothetical protein
VTETTKDQMTETTRVQPYPEWKNAVALFHEQGFTYGYRVPEEWLAEAFGLEPVPPGASWEAKQDFTLRFLRSFTSMKEWLLAEHQMLLWPHPDGGYEVVPPRKQTALAMGELNLKITREFKKVRDRLRGTNLGLLSQEEQRRHADASARVAQLSGMMLGARRRQERLAAPARPSDERAA